MDCPFQEIEGRPGFWTCPDCNRILSEKVPFAVPPKRNCPAHTLDGPCVHRGEYTGEVKECPTCSGRDRIKIFHCEVWQECTIEKTVLDEQGFGLPCCATCRDYKRIEV